MKRIRPSNPAPKCPDYIHSLPKRLADDLHQKPGERYSKYEAFRYLCERQAVHSSDQSRNHTDPFTVTITLPGRSPEGISTPSPAILL